jgi:hypothetical protein
LANLRSGGVGNRKDGFAAKLTAAIMKDRSQGLKKSSWKPGGAASCADEYGFSQAA